jgi:energy-coupling factor transporter ATP-binding protein EcfA2
MRRVVINRFGNNLDVSADGRGRLPNELREVLEPELTYTHIILLRGHDAWDQFGKRRPVKTERKTMFVYDGRGRMVCKAGFLSRLLRVLCENGYHPVTVDKTPPHPRSRRFDTDWEGVFAHFDPRAGQEEALLKIASNDCGVIEAPTGFGKTWLFKMIAALYPHANILITVSRKDVAQDIYRDMTKHFPNVGMIGAGRKRKGRITVCMAQSLQHAGYYEWDIVLGDEVHELATPSAAKHLVQMQWSRNFGFSASPWDRTDGTSTRVEAVFGETVFSMTYQEAVALGLVVPIRVKWLNAWMDCNPCGDYHDTARLRHGLWRNDCRNKLFADESRNYGDDVQTLIMVAHFEHAVYLKRFLPEYALCYAERPEDNTLFDRSVRDGLLPQDEPRMTDARRMKLREQFETGKLKKVIATDVWSTGVNFHGLQVLLRADARSSSIKDTQIPGRVCRPHEPSGKHEGILVDSLDQFDPGFRDAARKRRRDYAAKGWAQDLPPAGRNLPQG